MWIKRKYWHDINMRHGDLTNSLNFLTHEHTKQGSELRRLEHAHRGALVEVDALKDKIAKIEKDAAAQRAQDRQTVNALRGERDRLQEGIIAAAKILDILDNYEVEGPAEGSMAHMIQRLAGAPRDTDVDLLVDDLIATADAKARKQRLGGEDK